MQPQYKAFMSYTTTDEEQTNGYLGRLRERLSLAIRSFSGEEFKIFQEDDHIQIGQQSAQRITEVLRHSLFFIPIVTPTFFNDETCCEQLRQFLERERSLKRNELILPIQLLRLRPPRDPENKKLFDEINKRKLVDWTEWRKLPLDDPEVVQQIEHLAEQIVAAMDAVQAEAEPYTEDFASRMLAENQAMRQTIQEMRAEFARQMQQMSQQIVDLKQSVEEPQQIDTRLVQINELRTRFDNLMRQHNRADYNMRRLVRERDAMLNYLMQANRTFEAGRVERSEKDAAEMVFVPAALFVPGRHRASAEECRKAERFVKAFYIDKYPVTNRQFRQFVTETGYETIAERQGWPDNWQTPRGEGSTSAGLDDHPVVYVHRADALAYARWAGRRLPTRLEWERAMRGVAGLTWPWGNEWHDGRCNLGGTITTPVAQFPGGVSPVGCWDMLGNVWEWLADKLDDGKFLLMGGSWAEPRSNMPVGFKFRIEIDGTHSNIGFRCAMDAPEPGSVTSDA